MVGSKATVLLFALIIVLSQVPKLQCAASIGEDGQADLKSINVQHRQRNLLQAIDCGSACGKRCSKSGLVKRCIYFCNVCCQKCQCVPPGTYGNKESCPCYASLKNSKGKDKCP